MAITQAQAAEWLAEAYTAYHSLVTGTSARVVVDQNGERVEYTSANRAGLKAWIDELEGILGQKAVTGPMRILF